MLPTPLPPRGLRRLAPWHDSFSYLLFVQALTHETLGELDVTDPLTFAQFSEPFSGFGVQFELYAHRAERQKSVLGWLQLIP